MNIFAITAVVFSSFSTAYFIIRKEIRRCERLDITLRLITAVKNKAMFYSEPFAEIIIQLQNIDNFHKLSFFNVFSENISSGMVVPDAWKNAICSSLEFDEVERNVLINFGTDMCSCSRAEITEISEQAIFEISELKKSAIEKRNCKSKATAAVTISMGLMVVLIFV